MASRRSDEQAEDAVASPRKLGLSFILNERVPFVAWGALPAEAARRGALLPTGNTSALALTRQREQTPQATHLSPSARSLSGTGPHQTASRKRGRTCKAEGCDKYTVYKGFCCRHGGGKKCSFDGCQSSAKHGGRCWKHGGSVECKIPDCTKKAKARGLCWAHGGGANCQADACTKVAISNGFCWAHGGGRRCIFDGCQRPAFERTHSFCLRHYDALQGVDYHEV